MEAVAATAPPAEAQDAQALAGDREAFNTLYRPQFEAVYDFVLRVVREGDLAADVVRDTFARAWRAFPEQGKDAAAALSREEYSLLALEVRHDFTADELGESAARSARKREALDEHVVFQLV